MSDTIRRASPRVWVFVLCLYVQAGPLPAQAEDTQIAATSAREQAWLTQFSRRAEQVARLLLQAISDARDHGQADHVRCFDRALRELHSLRRQVAFHSERAQDLTLDEESRARHTRALNLSHARLDYVAESTARCPTDGPRLQHAQTRVETTFER